MQHLISTGELDVAAATRRPLLLRPHGAVGVPLEVILTDAKEEAVVNTLRRPEPAANKPPKRKRLSPVVRWLENGCRLSIEQAADVASRYTCLNDLWAAMPGEVEMPDALAAKIRRVLQRSA